MLFSSLLGLMEDSFIFRGKCPEENIDYVYDLIESQYNLLRFLTISYIDNQYLDTNLIYYYFVIIEYISCVDER